MNDSCAPLSLLRSPNPMQSFADACWTEGTNQATPAAFHIDKGNARRVEQQGRTDFCVPKYARDSFNLTTWVESGFLVDGPSGASTEEGLALGAVGGRARWVTVTLV